MEMQYRIKKFKITRKIIQLNISNSNCTLFTFLKIYFFGSRVRNFQQSRRYSLEPSIFFRHETTSTTLSWSLYMLLKHPEVLEKVREEVDRVYGDQERLSSTELNKLDYLSMVVRKMKEKIEMHFNFNFD